MARAKPKPKPKKKKSGMAATKARPPLKPGKDGVVRLAGGNPQIAKGDGDAPVQAFIKAMPGWQRDVGRRLDALVERTVPGVKKAVKWNSPFYGVEGKGWFLSFHCFTKYVKVAFFKGARLRPKPPVESKDANARYVHIQEGEGFDEDQMATWLAQAAAIPGWMT